MRKSTRHVACDICHFKKRHCDGEQPCYQCVNRGLECSYDRKMKRARSSSNPPQPAAAAANNSNTTNPTTTQQNEQTSTANNNSSGGGGINRELDFSISDWQVFRQAVTNFGELQTNTYQDFIHWDLYVEEIPIETRHLLWKLIQGKENPSQIDPCHICTAYIYCSAIAIGLDYINHPSHCFWAQRSYEMIKLLIESGGIEKLDHENQKLIVVDHILKEVYYYIKRNDLYKAIYLSWQAKLVAALTEPTVTLPDQDPDIPTFIKIHLNTFKVWTVKSIKKKISTLKNCVRDISRVQTGTSVLSALLVCCESAEIYSTLMKGIRVPIDPTYAETVYEYMKSIYEIHNIQEAPADKKLIFALSLTLLNIRSEATPKTIETNLSWAYNLLSSLQNRDTNTCWLSGIGISLSLLCNSDLMFQFREYQRIISNPYYIEWQQKNGLEEKMLSHCLEQQFDDPVDLLVNL